MSRNYLPGVDFINVPRTTFTPVALQSVRTQVKLSVSFYAKAARRTLMKLTPDDKNIVEHTSTV